jgi:hypothetical protein
MKKNEKEYKRVVKIAEDVLTGSEKKLNFNTSITKSL